MKESFTVFFWFTASCGTCVFRCFAEPTASIFRVIDSGSGGEYSIDTSLNYI